MSVEVMPDGVMAYTTIGLVEQMYLQTKCQVYHQGMAEEII